MFGSQYLTQELGRRRLILLRLRLHPAHILPPRPRLHSPSQSVLAPRTNVADWPSMSRLASLAAPSSLRLLSDPITRRATSCAAHTGGRFTFATYVGIASLPAPFSRLFSHQLPRRATTLACSSDGFFSVPCRLVRSPATQLASFQALHPRATTLPCSFDGRPPRQALAHTSRSDARPRDRSPRKDRRPENPRRPQRPHRAPSPGRRPAAHYAQSTHSWPSSSQRRSSTPLLWAPAPSPH